MFKHRLGWMGLFLVLSWGTAFSQTPTASIPSLTAMPTAIPSQPTVIIHSSWGSQTSSPSTSIDNIFSVDHSDPNYTPVVRRSFPAGANPTVTPLPGAAAPLPALPPLMAVVTPVSTPMVYQPIKAYPLGLVFLELAGGIDLPAQNWQSAYTLGGGGKVAVGLELDKNFSLQLDVECYRFSGSNYAGEILDYEFHLLPTIRYFFDGEKIRPYLLAGLGTDMEFLATVGSNATVFNLDAAVGAGVEVPFSGKTVLFVEAKLNLIFAYSVVGEDVPLSFGMRFGI